MGRLHKIVGYEVGACDYCFKSMGVTYLKLAFFKLT